MRKRRKQIFRNWAVKSVGKIVEESLLIKLKHPRHMFVLLTNIEQQKKKKKKLRKIPLYSNTFLLFSFAQSAKLNKRSGEVTLRFCCW